MQQGKQEQYEVAKWKVSDLQNVEAYRRKKISHHFHSPIPEKWCGSKPSTNSWYPQDLMSTCHLRQIPGKQSFVPKTVFGRKIPSAFSASGKELKFCTKKALDRKPIRIYLQQINISFSNSLPKVDVQHSTVRLQLDLFS